MKALPKILLALTAVAALLFASPARANLITNPGFETGDFSGWTNGNSASAVFGTFDGFAPHSGNFQAAMSFASANIAQSVATTPGTTYTIDFFAAPRDAFVSSPNFTLTVNFGGTIFSHLFISVAGYAEYTFNATASGANTNLSFLVIGSGGALLLDDVSVNAVGTVPDGGTTASLLGCALLGLAGLRRKLGCQEPEFRKKAQVDASVLYSGMKYLFAVLCVALMGCATTQTTDSTATKGGPSGDWSRHSLTH